MSASILLRFVSPDNGPIISISSAPYPNFWRRWLWHSTAYLHPSLNLDSAPLKIFGSCGGGWSCDKEQSQCKAITEAIERWAYHYYFKIAPKEAGIDIDSTSNGFAALPYFLGEKQVVMNAYCESLERWALSRLWDYGDLQFQEHKFTDKLWTKLFRCYDGELQSFRTRLLTRNCEQVLSNPVIFQLCLFKTKTGGVIPGSACGIDEQIVVERSLTETFINLLAFKRMQEQKLTNFENIIEQRLYYFGNGNNTYSLVSNRIKTSNTCIFHETPEIVFLRHISGPWNPDILVYRVLVKDSRPAIEGGENRFLI